MTNKITTSAILKRLAAPVILAFLMLINGTSLHAATGTINRNTETKKTINKKTINERIGVMLRECSGKNHYYDVVESYEREILSWGDEGIKVFLAYSLKKPQTKVTYREERFLESALRKYDKDLLPFLVEALEGRYIPREMTYDKRFNRDLDLYFAIFDKYPDEASFFLKKIASWEKTAPLKFSRALKWKILKWRFWDRVEVCPEYLDFFPYFFKVKEKKEYYDREKGIIPSFDEMQKYSLPVFYKFAEDFEKESTWDLEDALKSKRITFDFLPYKKYIKKDRGNKITTLPIEPYDLRRAATIYQLFTLLATGLMEDRVSHWWHFPELIDIFPADASVDPQAVAFLKDFILYTENNRWYDAACILSSAIPAEQLKQYGRALLRCGLKEKGDYINELSQIPCRSFANRIAHNNDILFTLPAGIINREFVSKIKCNDSHSFTFNEAVEKTYYKSLKGHYDFASTKKKALPGLLTLLENGNLTQRLLALALLANQTAVADRFFLDILSNENEKAWLKVAALQALEQRKTPIPAKLLSSLLKHKNDFIVFYALKRITRMVQDNPTAPEERGHTGLGTANQAGFGTANQAGLGPVRKILGKLTGDNKICQRMALKTIYHLDGYGEYKRRFSKITKENLTLKTRRDFIINAYENKDTGALLPYFKPGVPGTIFVPAANALFKLQSQATVTRIHGYLAAAIRGDLQKKRWPLNSGNMDTMLLILAKTPDRRSITLLKKIYRKGYWRDEIEKVLLQHAQIMTPEEITWLEGISGKYSLMRYMCRNYNKNFKPYLRRYISRKGLRGMIDYMTEGGNMAFQPLWRKYLHDIEAREKPENMSEALKIAFVSGERTKRTSFMEDITNLPPADAVKELTWCAGSNDDSTAFHALRHLLYYPTFKDEIDPLMRGKLASKNQYHKIPAIIWFVRQGETRD
ncbi:MAG: hypothetical protein GY757_62180, partial [bacterium]|nr:hypothetical protein [bacterium]